MESASLVILHEDADCLALVKPAGQFPIGTWAPPGECTLEQDVRRHLAPDDPAGVYLGIVHRLDRPTSGVLIWAKTPRAARRLSLQFEQRKALKEYWALVEAGAGIPASGADEETWSDWLTRPGKDGLVRLAEPGTPGARQAVTRVRREPSSDLPAGLAWLRLRPETGRTHQLRAQCAARGGPIVGDAGYGSTRTFEAPEAIALHARWLRIWHPTVHQSMELIAPLPVAWHAYGLGMGLDGRA